MTFKISAILLFLVLSASAFAVSDNNTVALSQNFIEKLHLHQNTQSIEDEIGTLEHDFFKKIEHSTEKHIFWINLYNGFTLKSIRENPNLLDNMSFRAERKFLVAGQKVSLDDIEFLFLNRGKKSNGENKFFVRKKFKSWMVPEPNKDIFYVLYRGYKESPPVSYFVRDNFNGMVVWMKRIFYENQVMVGRGSCMAPQYMKNYIPIYFKNEDSLRSEIIKNTFCENKVITYSKTMTPDGSHFYPRILR